MRRGVWNTGSDTPMPRSRSISALRRFSPYSNAPEAGLAFAQENRDTLFQPKKSLDMLTGTIGYRTGMPQFKTDKGFTQAAVIQLIKDQYPDLVPTFIKSTEAINKEAIIGESRRTPDDPMRIDMLEFQRRCHAFVTQEETFFVQPKEEEVEPN